MTEQELRMLVRDAIARQGIRSHFPLVPADKMSPDPFIANHASHGLLPVASGGEACIIEPSVPCNHCGYCKSFGH